MSRPFRTELKYVVHHGAMANLLARWSRHLVRDPHTDHLGFTPVLSQYYDTPELGFYREKIDGLPFRNKVRLRTYDTSFDRGATAFLEIKQRLSDRVRKIRSRLDAVTARDLDPGSWRFDDPRDTSAFGSLTACHPLIASAQVFYVRRAFFSAVEPSVRVTFDTGLQALFPGERVGEPSASHPSRLLMSDTLAVLEVKATGGLPPWVTGGAKAVELVQQPVPKYVSAVERLGTENLISGGIFHERV
ncbi:MAG: polyphosphate polymerase domain-containing protein [Thermoanaerobaculia bacterium]|nr:polyphosphate polymerase domain-containing protein [Thermoanaerobaculia bacterium]